MLATSNLAHTLSERERRGLLSATPERLAKTDEPFRVVGEAQAQELMYWPLWRLWKSGALGSADKIGKERHDAGEAYYQCWFHGKLYPLGSRDYRKPYTGNNPDPYSLAPSQERTEHARQKYREMEHRLKLGQIIADRVWRVTQMIVIDEMEPAEVGFIVAARKDKAQARAVAVEFLIEGLDRLRRKS